jgi:hypothetical protein
MNFNIYVKKEIVIQLANMVKALHHSRNSIINESLEKWLNHPILSQCPKFFFDFNPIEDVPDFKKMREYLKTSAPEDPLA